MSNSAFAIIDCIIALALADMFNEEVRSSNCGSYTVRPFKTLLTKLSSSKATW